MLMFIGACAGSTGGGIKVSRFLILGKTLAKELNALALGAACAPTARVSAATRIRGLKFIV